MSQRQIREIRAKGIPTVVYKQGNWERVHLDTLQRISKTQEEEENNDVNISSSINKAPQNRKPEVAVQL
jgi:hypothetical protein